MAYLQSWKICENSLHMVSFKCFAFAWVIWPCEKSKTSSDSSLSTCMLFAQRDSLVRDAPTMSVTKDGQFLGHSFFSICKRRTD